MIFTGPRQDVVVRLRALYPDLVIHHQPVDARLWDTEPWPPTTWLLCDPQFSPEGLIPRADRLVWQEKAGGAWKAWARKHKLQPDDACAVTYANALVCLVGGSLGLRFTPDAAGRMLQAHPGGLAAFVWPIRQLQALHVPTPVPVEWIDRLWPVDEPVTRYRPSYTLPEAIQAMADVPDKLLGYLRKRFEEHSSADLQAVLTAVTDRRLDVRSAWVLYHLWKTHPKRGRLDDPIIRLLIELS
jgi:hypothetical protein